MAANSEKQQQFLTLFEPVRHRLSHYVQAMVFNRDEARDIVSETIALAYERFSSVHTPQSFVFFLFTIARRLHSKRRWRQRLFLPLATEHGTRHSNERLPDASAEVRLLHEALAKLPFKHGEAIALFYLSGMSLEEIRAIQGGTVSGVKSRLRRGKQHLAELLGAEDDMGEPLQQERAQQQCTNEQQLNTFSIALCVLFTSARFL